jgi:membrane fusion protein, multidrug efflux system
MPLKSGSAARAARWCSRSWRRAAGEAGLRRARWWRRRPPRCCAPKAGGTLLALQTAVAEGSRVRGRPGAGPHRPRRAGQPRGRAQRLLESARAALAQAERSHASNERLAAQQFISPIALENSRAAVDTARAALQAAQAALDTTRVGLRDATLLAPIAGIVAKRHVLPGEKVAPSSRC